jgi:predicted Zn-dependent peptidase
VVPAPAPGPAAAATAPGPATPASPPAGEIPAPVRTVPGKGPPPELRLPEQRHFALTNGLRVRLVEYHRLPIVALSLVVDAGGARDPAARPGLASFTAAMLTEGTRTRSAVQISDDVGFLGATLGAGAGPDSASISGSVLARHLPRYLEIFADVVRSPSFPQADFARVQDQRLVTLLQQRDQPQAIAARTFVREYWGDHPYGHSLLGTEASVKALLPAELRAFHARFYRPDSAELVVVGDVTEKALRPMLEKALGARWPRPGTARPPPLQGRPPAAPLRTVVLEKAGAPQTYLLMASPGLVRASPDYYAASVAFQVLGGGTASRLFRNLREEKGYTYGIYASGDARRLGGASVIAGSVRADSTGLALRELLAEVKRMREEPVGEAELEDARNALVLSLPAEFATAGAIAGRLADLVVQGLPDDYWNGYAARVKAVGAEEVRRVAGRYLDPSRLTLVLVGAPDVVTPQLADLPLGPAEVRAGPPG